MVADVARAVFLRDQPGQLGVRVAGDLGEGCSDQTLPGHREADVVPEPDQCGLNDRVGGLAVVGGVMVCRLVPVEEAADVRRGSGSVRCRVSRSCSAMICSHPRSCLSLETGFTLTHFSLDNAAPRQAPRSCVCSRPSIVSY